jgi:hypothetical protein
MRSNRARLFTHAIAWGLFVLLAAVGVPCAEAFFADRDIPLPGATMFVIRASHLRAVFLLLIPGLAALDGYVLDRLSKKGDVAGARSWSAVVLTAALPLIALFLAALVLPLLTIEPRLSG